MFKEGKAGSTINVYRSALSSTLDPEEGAGIGNHPLVVLLMKGIYNQRPPTPKYTSTWSVDGFELLSFSGPEQLPRTADSDEEASRASGCGILLKSGRIGFYPLGFSADFKWQGVLCVK